MQLMIIRVASLILCGVIALAHSLDLFFMESGGGEITGTVIRLCLMGSAVFFFDVPITWFFRRAAVVIAGIAALFCVPFYLYLLLPASLNWLSSAPSSAVATPDFSFDPWAIAGILSLLFMIVVHLKKAPRKSV